MASKNKNMIYKIDNNNYIKRCCQYGVMYYNAELPNGAVFGKWKGYPFYCTFEEDNLLDDGTMVLYRIDKRGKWHKHWSSDTDGLLSAIRQNCITPQKINDMSLKVRKFSQQTVREKKPQTLGNGYMPMSCNYSQSRIDGSTLGGSYTREMENGKTELVEMDSFIRGDKSSRYTEDPVYWMRVDGEVHRDGLKTSFKDYRGNKVNVPRDVKKFRDEHKYQY